MYQNKSINEIIHAIKNGIGLFSQAQLYGLLLKREGLEMEVNGSTSKMVYCFFNNEILVCFSK